MIELIIVIVLTTVIVTVVAIVSVTEVFISAVIAALMPIVFQIRIKKNKK